PKRAEDLSEEEDNWIRSAYMRGLPVKVGEFKTITCISTNSDNKYRIYHAFIGNQLAEQKCTEAFHYNPTGYYTYYNLKIAIDIDLYIKLFFESSNALIFKQNQLISGQDIFYQWASYLIKIKHEGKQVEKVAKHMFVSL
ncbi:20277_t:CDS:2, partial [Gigaspora margarita]